MTGKQTAPAPTASELRQEARLILDRIRVTTDREQKHRLAVRAFELVQLAEQLTHDKEQGQIHLHADCSGSAHWRTYDLKQVAWSEAVDYADGA